MPLPLAALGMGAVTLFSVLGPTIGILSERVKQLALQRLPINLIPVESLTVLRYRKLISDETYFSQMGQHGFNNERAEAIFTASAFFPSPQDLVTWQAKEVFEPKSIEKFGLAEEFGELDLSLFAKAGVDQEQARNFWIAHWQHPSLGQVIAMLRRDVLAHVLEGRETSPGSAEWEAQRQEAEELVFEWFRLVEIPPFWRDRLRQASTQTLTRVDVRRMWDLGVVDDDKVVRSYLDQGYELEDAQALLLFTKVERRLPDLIALYRNQFINLEELKEQAVELGLGKEQAEFLIATKVSNLDAPLRVARERDLTKSEIIKGAKKDLITREQASTLLTDMGYDLNEATFIIAINLEAEGSPETFSDFKDLTQRLRKAEGKPTVDIPQSLRDAEHRVLNAQRAVETKEADRKSPGDLEVLKAEVARARAALTGERQAYQRLLSSSAPPKEDVV